LIPAPRADLQYAVARLEPERFQIQRLERWLRRGLAKPDRQRRVLVRAMPHRIRHERVARHEIEYPQHLEIPDAPLTDGLDQLPPLPLVLSVRHNVRSHPLRPSSSR